MVCRVGVAGSCFFALANGSHFFVKLNTFVLSLGAQSGGGWGRFESLFLIFGVLRDVGVYQTPNHYFQDILDRLAHSKSGRCYVFRIM